MDKFRQIQENLLDYFKDVDDATFIEFVDCFAYDASTDNEEVSKLSEKFIEDQGLFDAIINHKYDQTEKASYFSKSSLSQRNMLIDIKTALVSLSHNRFRASLNTSKDTSKNKTNFNYLKRELLDCYESLNRNENYFFSEKADAEIVKRITKLEYQN